MLKEQIYLLQGSRDMPKRVIKEERYDPYALKDQRHLPTHREEKNLLEEEHHDTRIKRQRLLASAPVESAIRP